MTVSPRPVSCCWPVPDTSGPRCRRIPCAHEWWRGVRALIDSIFAAPAGSAPRGRTGYSDVVLAFAAVTIISVMILPLPVMAIDTLVAVNISIGFGLLLLAIYIPTPVAFSSFPSVLLLTTLFRLALSIAITRSILLTAEGGHIVETFGTLAAAGHRSEGRRVGAGCVSECRSRWCP